MMVGGFGFAIALVPTIISKQKPTKVTCAMTGTILTSYVVALATLGLLLSAIATGITAIMWWILLIQRRQYSK